MAQSPFANILFSGPCNLQCPGCIGRLLGSPLPSNLSRWPLLGIERLIAVVREEGIRQLSVTGTDTDPLLYRPTLHHRLLDLLRAELPAARLSLHTNGLLALRRQDIVERYDRVSLSLATLDPTTAKRLTGRRVVLDLERLASTLSLPLKLSVLVTEHNAAEVRGLVARVARLGIRRLVLRRPVTPAGHSEPPLVARLPWLADLAPQRRFGGNPVFAVDGVEVTAWDFNRSELDCFNLFADGTLSRRYQLAATRGEPCRAPAVAGLGTGGPGHAA